MLQVDITRTPTFFRGGFAVRVWLWCYNRTRGSRYYVSWPFGFYMRVTYFVSVSNHNRQIATSNASVRAHSPFLLVGDYVLPTEHEISFCGCVLCKYASALKWHAKGALPFAGIKQVVCLYNFWGCHETKQQLSGWGGKIPAHLECCQIKIYYPKDWRNYK